MSIPVEDFDGDEKNSLRPHISSPNGDVFISPGTGPVLNATLENATINMEQYIKDSSLADDLRFECADDENGDGDGRFKFIVYWIRCDYFSVMIDMPGWPLERVRYMNEPGQDIWDFPRLYVEGSSWVWEFAILD